jgi:hypothetical protein
MSLGPLLGAYALFLIIDGLAYLDEVDPTKPACVSVAHQGHRKW